MKEEKFQPISVKSPSSNILLFSIRCWIDLQLGSIVKHLRPAMVRLQGHILDVGAGESPWREWLPQSCSYHGIDVDNALDYGMQGSRPDLTYYDGKIIPFSDQSFDGALCIEVLEHVETPEGLLKEVSRVLRDGSPLLLSVPWSARRHHIPHDYHRFTRERLAILLGENGFTNVRISERGNDLSAIASKMIVVTIRLCKPSQIVDLIWMPLAPVAAFMAAGMVAVAHISGVLGTGAKEDPLGYFVHATRAPRKHSYP